ncbi:MAG: GTP-binding protein [Promethearchaeota archaeon]
MSIYREGLLSNLGQNFIEINPEIQAIIVSDRDGLIISGEKRADIDLEIVSVLTAIVNPILERIRDEFSFKKFGNASFDTDDHRLLFISVDEQITLSLVIDNMASIDKFSPYAFFLAEKVAQILNAKDNDVIQLILPNFDYATVESQRLKHQVYQLRLESGGIYRFKFIILGDHEVGKTSIVRRFVEDKFSYDYRATIGLNILSHDFEAFSNKISLSLWDIGAQKYFKRFRKTYYMGAQAAFLVFDITNRQTFDNIDVWLNELNEFLDNLDLSIIIIGNKTDLEQDRQVSKIEGADKAAILSKNRSKQISYIETSALSGENIGDAFNLISYHHIIKSKEKEEERLKKGLANQIESILAEKAKLSLVFIAENPFWSPGLQVLTEIYQLGKYAKVKDTKNEKLYEYNNGLRLKNYLYDNYRISEDDDGVLCIFDARQRTHIDPFWKDIVVNIIKTIRENKVVLIGIRVPEKIDWSVLMEEMNVNYLLEDKMVSLLFFKIGGEYRLEIFDELQIMLSTIKM